MKLLRYLKLMITVIFLVGILYFVRSLDYNLMVSLFIKSNKSLFFLALLLIFASLALKIFRLRILTNYYLNPIGLKYSAAIQAVGISLALITPGRIGEFSKIFLLHKYKMPLPSSISLLIFERLFDLLFLALSSLLFAVLIIKNSKLTVILAIFTIITLLALFFMKWLRILSKLLPKKYNSLLKGLGDIKLKGKFLSLLLITILTISAWVSEAMLQWLFALSIGIKLNLFLIIGVLSISTVVALLSLLPAGLGTMDLSILYLYSVIGLTPEVSASLLLVARFFGTLIPFIFALIMMKFTGLDFQEIKYKSEEIAIKNV